MSEVQLSLSDAVPDPAAAPAEAPVSAPVRVLPPLARDVVKALAVEHGVCVRPVPMRRIDLHTGASEMVYVPCGHTLASVCPTCAERKKKLRAVQCREGWHLESEPVIERADPDEEQRFWMELRARVQAERDQAEKVGEDLGPWDQALAEIDAEIERLGIRGHLRTGE